VQLPYQAYPEGQAVHKMAAYEPLRGYVHSTRLRWSHGATRGRPADWQDDAAVLAPQELAVAATTAGFGAVWLDRNGFVDDGAGVVGALSAVTGTGPTATSADGRLLYFDLRALGARVVAKTTPGERRDLRDALVRPVGAGYGSGFSYLDSAEGFQFRWAGVDAQVVLGNTMSKPRTVRVSAGFYGGGPQPTTVTMRLPGGAQQTVTVTDKGMAVDIDVVIPPGGGTLRLHSDGPAAPTPPGDARDLRLRVVDLRAREAPLATDRIGRLVAAVSG
jgi:hypothetical protein